MLIAIEDGAISHKHTKGRGGLDRKVKKLGYAGSEEIVGTSTIYEDCEADMVDSSKKKKSFRGRKT